MNLRCCLTGVICFIQTVPSSNNNFSRPRVLDGCQWVFVHSRKYETYLDVLRHTVRDKNIPKPGIHIFIPPLPLDQFLCKTRPMYATSNEKHEGKSCQNPLFSNLLFASYPKNSSGNMHPLEIVYAFPLTYIRTTNGIAISQCCKPSDGTCNLQSGGGERAKVATRSPACPCHLPSALSAPRTM